MSNQKQPRSSVRRDRGETPFISERFQHTAALLIMCISLLVFFGPVLFGGKTFLGPDTISSHSFDTFVQDAKAQGISPLWNPYIFCGYPGVASLTVTGDRWFDLSLFTLNKIQNLFGSLTANFSVGVVLFYYLILGLGAYILAFKKTSSRMAALLGSLATVFSMYIIIWVMVGHNTKIVAMAWYPWIFLALEDLRQRFRWSVAAGLALLFHFVFASTHVQMVYYTGLAVALWIVVELTADLIKKNPWKPLVRTAAIAGIAAAVAFAMDADRYLSVLEYNPHSIRGSGPLVTPPGETGTPKADGGLDYEYATNWSLAPGELMTLFVPTWYGFGHLEYEGRLSAQPVAFNGYWGPQPFTDGAQYMGAAVLILALIGFARYRRDPFVVYLGILVVGSIFIAFGKEFPIIYDVLYRFAPGFNKFRIPSMILVLVQLSVPLLAAYGVRAIHERSAQDAPATQKRWMQAAYVLGGVLGLSIVARGVFEDLYRGIFPFQEVAQKFGRQFGSVDSRVLMEIYEFVVDTVITDLYVTLVGAVVVVGGAVLFWKQRLSWQVYAVALIAVSMFDLVRISSRPMNPQPRQNQTAIFAAPDYVQALQQDTTLFRTLTIQDGQFPFDNTLAYWRIQSAYGYQGAKMRSYQDVLDVAGLGNPLVWQLMNVKYIITNTPDSSGMLALVFQGREFSVYGFRGFLRRAFFVNRFEVASAEQTLNHMANRSFNPLDVAFLQADPGVQIDPPGPDAQADIVKFGIQDLTISVKATGNNLLFLSETYYPEGWKAYLDGTEVPILRTNYLFRGIVVPAGEHTIEMRFEPTGYAVGKNLSLGMNILVISGLGLVGWNEWRRMKGRRVPLG